MQNQIPSGGSSGSDGDKGNNGTPNLKGGTIVGYDNNDGDYDVE